VSIPPNWNTFLTNGQNKANLASFYTEYMVINAGNTLSDTQT
jgi:hypothetical protein